MKKNYCIGLIQAIAVVCLCGALYAEDGKSDASSGDGAIETFSIDPVHSTALFRVQHMGAGPFWGRFNEVTGTISFREGSDNDLSMEIEISIRSIDTGSRKLDGHIKSEDFFYAEEFPTATFKSKSARKIEGNLYELSGDLTMRGVTKPIKVNVAWLGTADGRRGKKIGFEADFTVKRSDFGINYGVSGGAVGDETRIIIALEGSAVDSAKRGGRRGRRSRD